MCKCVKRKSAKCAKTVVHKMRKSAAQIFFQMQKSQICTVHKNTNANFCRVHNFVECRIFSVQVFFFVCRIILQIHYVKIYLHYIIYLSLT